jgi:hypothetical protein
VSLLDLIGKEGRMDGEMLVDLELIYFIWSIYGDNRRDPMPC